MASKFSKSTDFFAKESRDSKERQEAIVTEVSGAAAAPAEPQAPVKRGRPASGGSEPREELVQISGYVPASMKKRLKICSATTDVPVSEIMRQVLEKYLSENGF